MESPPRSLNGTGPLPCEAALMQRRFRADDVTLGNATLCLPSGAASLRLSPLGLEG